ncbi:hypothetical protein DQ04_00701030 [Trypanosoma grayi]|uniref:hypothetical protein n=1 Tax=Trypanosoma grayi TaxID=71804 RepID=UPI0004F40889|nr:hypothetical protein DQ04_00701030 [Trypanosoma grayi]KEG13945.1 hypothetical protein DQ04_00701030 [Trypanosoma grayi]
MSFSAFLHCDGIESDTSKASRGTLYIVDKRGQAFSCIILGPLDTIKESKKGVNAFAIVGEGGGKTVLQAPSSVAKTCWVRVLTYVIHGDYSGIASVPQPPPTENSSAAVLPEKHGSRKDGSASMKGVLLKKGGRTGQYVKRWFELIPGEGLLHAPDEKFTHDSLRRVPLVGLSVTFSEAKRQIVVPPSTARPQGMVLRCQRAEDFLQWRNAICTESSGLSLTRPVGHVVSVAAVPPENKVGIRPPPAGDDDGSLHSSEASAPSASVSFAECALDGTVRENVVGADAVVLTAQELVELEDLQRDTPCGCASVVDATLESLGEKYTPLKNTPGVDEELQRYYAECLPYGLEAALQRLRQRLLLPIREPYEAVNEHMVLLDLDVERVRECLRNTLRLYGEEVAVRSAVEEMDYILRVYTRVREQLLIRLDIAAFREQPNQCGLPLGVNGTVDALDTLLPVRFPSAATYTEAVGTWKGLFRALHTFRLDFDLFDESEETIVVVENALKKLYDWLQQNTPESEEGKEDLR